jgi:hypothetical protein
MVAGYPILRGLEGPSMSPYPVRLGTTYLDAGPIQKPGSVTEFGRPRHLCFHHTVRVRHVFEP